MQNALFGIPGDFGYFPILSVQERNLFILLKEPLTLTQRQLTEFALGNITT